jgi:tetratricopeptide (TPR) repeat protein
MAGEDTGSSRGSKDVPDREPDATPRTKQNKGAEVVRVEVVEDDESATPFSVTEAEEADLTEAAVTLGEIVDGTKEVFDTVAVHARRLIDRGRYRKIRISHKGKPVLPDIPLAAAAAIEAASMYGAGIARVLAVNVGARFLFDVEVVNEADKYFERGKQAVLDGDLDRALEALEKAVRIDDTHAGAYLQLGVLFRLRGERSKAQEMLERARGLDENGDVGRRAEEILKSLEAARD